MPISRRHQTAPRTPAKPKRFQVYLNQSAPSYSCFSCGTDLATRVALVTKSFSGMEGRGFFIQPWGVFNVKIGDTLLRTFITGEYRVANVYCVSCSVLVGWKYVEVTEPSQKYKEGSYVLEENCLLKNNCWM